MNRRRITLVAAVSAALVLGGCSSSDDGQAAASSSSAPATSSAAPTTTSAAADEVRAWASKFCTAVTPAYDSTASIDPSQADLSSPEAAKAFFVDLYGRIAQGFTDSASAIGDLDAPPVDGAEDFVSKAQAAFVQTGDNIRGLAEQAKDVDLTDPAALKDLTSGLDSGADPTAGVFDEVDANTPAELQRALETAPDCAPLNN